MNPSTCTAPAGLILLSHPEQVGITHRDMIDALPERYRGSPHVFVDLDMQDVARQAIHSTEWTAARRELERRVREKLEPIRRDHPDYRIVYLGSSSVPLAIHLGHLLETWQQVDVIPHHHVQRTWGWAANVPVPRLVPTALPEHTDRTPGEAVIRVSTSHPVDPQLTRRVVSSPLVELDVALERPAEDAFPRVDEMVEVAVAFRRALDAIGVQFPGVSRVHLFAAVQPAVALLLGAQISKTMHPPVQTYQYARNAEDGVFHLPAVLVNAPARPELGPLTIEDKETAARDRQALALDLDRINEFAARESRRAGGWLMCLLQAAEPSEFCGQWRALPTIGELPATSVDRETCEVADSFRLSPKNEWQLDDRWLARLVRRIPEEDRRRRALRLLVLHEASHRGQQRLTRTSSRQIGRFPKVLEEMDYHADVWAMLHEHALAGLHGDPEVENPCQLAMQLISIATETMWAFDEEDEPLDEIQIRRLNRYLIWYWQYLVFEVRGRAGRGQELDDVLAVLAHRPLIELAGPPVVARNERVYFALDPARVVMPELAVYHAGKLYRHGRHPGFDIPELLRAVRERDAGGIIDVLRGAVEQTVC